MITKYLLSPVLVILLILIASCGTDCMSVGQAELERIGMLIFRNEASGKVENLTVWNEGEEFASLGIGHFLWYPAGKEYRFRETFPDVYRFMSSKGASPPEWMEELAGFDLPWSSRAEFYREFQSPEMTSLRGFLRSTMALQTLYMFGRLEKSLPEMLDSANGESKSNIRKQFYRVAKSPMGMYVLIDYVNFKGEGVSESERYNGQGWGLLQVLDNMSGEEPGVPALEEFASSAGYVLERRVRNSPTGRNEKRWLPGWKNRIKTYVPDESTLALYTKSVKDPGSEPGPADYLAALYNRIVCSFRKN